MRFALFRLDGERCLKPAEGATDADDRAAAGGDAHRAERYQLKYRVAA